MVACGPRLVIAGRRGAVDHPQPIDTAHPAPRIEHRPRRRRRFPSAPSPHRCCEVDQCGSGASVADDRTQLAGQLGCPHCSRSPRRPGRCRSGARLRGGTRGSAETTPDLGPAIAAASTPRPTCGRSGRISRFGPPPSLTKPRCVRPDLEARTSVAEDCLQRGPARRGQSRSTGSHPVRDGRWHRVHQRVASAEPPVFRRERSTAAGSDSGQHQQLRRPNCSRRTARSGPRTTTHGAVRAAARPRRLTRPSTKSVDADRRCAGIEQRQIWPARAQAPESAPPGPDPSCRRRCSTAPRPTPMGIGCSGPTLR